MVEGIKISNHNWRLKYLNKIQIIQSNGTLSLFLLLYFCFYDVHIPILIWSMNERKNTINNLILHPQKSVQSYNPTHLKMVSLCWAGHKLYTQMVMIKCYNTSNATQSLGMVPPNAALNGQVRPPLSRCLLTWVLPPSSTLQNLLSHLSSPCVSFVFANGGVHSLALPRGLQ